MLYGDPAPAAAASGPQAAVADALYPDKVQPEIAPPAPIQALREADARPEAALYPNTIDPGIEGYLQPLIDSDMPAEQRHAIGRELTRMAGDLGLDGQGISELIARGADPSVRGMTPEQATANRAEVTRMLEAEYGDRADKVLSMTKAFVQRDPRVVKMLEISRLGDDPATVLQLARLAVRARK